MKKVIKKEYLNLLLKENKIKFNGNIEKTIEKSKYNKEFKNDIAAQKLKSRFGNFLQKIEYKLANYKFPSEVMFLLEKMVEFNPKANTYIVGGAIRETNSYKKLI